MLIVEVRLMRFQMGIRTPLKRRDRVKMVREYIGNTNRLGTFCFVFFLFFFFSLGKVTREERWTWEDWDVNVSRVH